MSSGHSCYFSRWQISKRWKLQSIEQQEKELEAKRKSKEAAKRQAKKMAGKWGLIISEVAIFK